MSLATPKIRLALPAAEPREAPVAWRHKGSVVVAAAVRTARLAVDSLGASARLRVASGVRLPGVVTRRQTPLSSSAPVAASLRCARLPGAGRRVAGTVEERQRQARDFPPTLAPTAGPRARTPSVVGSRLPELPPCGSSPREACRSRECAPAVDQKSSKLAAPPSGGRVRSPLSATPRQPPSPEAAPRAAKRTLRLAEKPPSAPTMCTVARRTRTSVETLTRAIRFIFVVFRPDPT